MGHEDPDRRDDGSDGSGPPIGKRAAAGEKFHPQVEIRFGGQSAFVDEELAPLIVALWRAGVATVYSCQSAPVPPGGWRDPSEDERFQIVVPDVEELRRLLELVLCDDELVRGAFRYSDTPRWEYSLTPQLTHPGSQRPIHPPRLQVGVYIPTSQLARIQHALNATSPVGR